MSRIRAFVRHHALAAYFGLTFVISWGGVLILGAPLGMPATQAVFEANWPLVFLPYLLGPVTAGLVLTGVVDGRAGFSTLGRRLVSWKHHPGWYAFVVLLAPLAILLLLVPASVIWPEFAPALFRSSDTGSLIVMGLGIVLAGGGLLEEPGWTGFALPRLRQHYSALRAGLLLGFIWGIWHLLPTFWGSGDAEGVFSPMLFLPPLAFYLGVLPVYRLLMVQVHEHTHSLLLVVLMHASLTACSLFILAPEATGMPLLGYYLVLTAVLWVVYGVMQRMPGADRA